MYTCAIPQLYSIMLQITDEPSDSKAPTHRYMTFPFKLYDNVPQYTVIMATHMRIYIYVICYIGLILKRVPFCRTVFPDWYIYETRPDDLILPLHMHASRV